MMVEAASDHVKRKILIDRLPIIAGKNFQVCLKLVEKNRDSDWQSEDSHHATQDLTTLVEEFRQRWPSHHNLA
jgi:hypothetical protein